MPYITIYEWIKESNYKHRPVTFNVPNLHPTLDEIIHWLVMEESRQFHAWLENQHKESSEILDKDGPGKGREALVKIRNINWEDIVIIVLRLYNLKKFTVLYDESCVIPLEKVLHLSGDIALGSQGWNAVWAGILKYITEAPELVGYYMLTSALAWIYPNEHVLRFIDDGHRDPFPFLEKSTLGPIHRDLKRLIEQTLNPRQGDGTWDSFLKNITLAPDWPALTRLDPQRTLSLVIAGVRRLEWYTFKKREIDRTDIQKHIIYARCQTTVMELIKAILNQKPGWQDSEILNIADLLVQSDREIHKLIFPSILEYLRSALLDRVPSTLLLGQVIRLQIYYADKTLEQLLAESNPLGINFADYWVYTSTLELWHMEENERQSWMALLRHTLPEGAREPNRQWLKEAQLHIDTVGEANFRKYLLEWLPFAAYQWTVNEEKQLERVESYWILSDRGVEILNSLVWHASLIIDDEIQTALEKLAAKCYLKVYMGPYAARVGHSCCKIISNKRLPGCVESLRRILAICSHVETRSVASRCLVKASTSEPLSKEEMADRMVQDFGLDEKGFRRCPIGDWQAELRVEKAGRPELFWIGPSGKPRKGVPAAIAQAYPKEIRIQKQDVKEIEKIFQKQRTRLERFWLNGRTVDYADWIDRFIRHPILGILTKPLIWRFESDDRIDSGIWHEGQVVNAAGEPLDSLCEGVSVTLWHPLGESLENIAAWRKWILDHEITQPFRQAFRRFFSIDAESSDAVESNCLSGHVISDHFINSSLEELGWKQIYEGSHEKRFFSLNLPSDRLSVWLELYRIPDEQTGKLSCEYVRSGAIRFINRSKEAMPLSMVPPVIYSESLAHVDAFIDTYRIGKAFRWTRGDTLLPNPPFWHQQALGELTENGRIRREIVESLLLRIKQLHNCVIDERYLIVKGKSHEYHIHFNHGAVLIQPGSRILSMAWDSWFKIIKQFKDIPLPYERDMNLHSILSMALTFSRESRIKDPAILAQIQPV